MTYGHGPEFLDIRDRFLAEAWREIATDLGQVQPDREGDSS